MEQIALSAFGRSATEMDGDLMRCPAYIREAASEFRKTGDAALIPTILLRILESYVGRESCENLRKAGDRLRFAEDLGIDSLSMIEMMIVVEDVFAVAVGNAELRALRTVGDAHRFIERSLTEAAGRPPPQYR